MNKDIPCLEIETGRYIRYERCPISLMLDPRSVGIKYSKVYKWIQQRAVPLSRKNADAIYMAMQLPRDNSETELMYLTHSLSINDNFWIADEKEISNISYYNISLFRNSFAEAMYLVALKGNKFTISDSRLSPEFTGQGSYPKCFIRGTDGIYIVKNQSIQETMNEILACYIAELLGIKTAHYDYIKFSGLDCTKSKILTNEQLNWESAFSVSEALALRGQTPQEYMMKHYTVDFCNMIIFDALVLNADRHMKNWSFEIDAESNVIRGLSPSYDYNKAFEADSKTTSTLIFDNNRRLNILEAGRYTYNNYGCSIDLCGLYDTVDGLNVKMDKQAFKNRIAYILGRKDSQIDCY
jgi:hypothetical protein